MYDYFKKIFFYKKSCKIKIILYYIKIKNWRNIEMNRRINETINKQIYKHSHETPQRISF